jgi:hypothetical protein
MFRPYIFKRSGTSWSEQQKLTAGDIAIGDEFGYSVGISGDYAIVGAWRKSSYTGAAYIFKRDTNAETWTQQDKLTTTGSDSQTQDRFGQSVSIDGDYAIISGEGDNTYTGAAYIFKRDTNAETWTQQDKLTASDGLTLSWYGISASISGDYAIVGAYRHPQAGTPQKYGAAYIFKNNGTSWTEQQRLLASDGALSDEFGYSVSISGDYAIIGAHYDDTDGSGPNGSVYIYKLDGTNDVWTEHAKIILSDQTSGTIYGTGDQFGYSVAIDGGYAISGAYNINSAAGAAYIYEAPNLIPTLTQDNYNKLTLNSLNDIQSSRLTLNSNTYTANGPVSKFFVNEAGTYEVSANGSNAYAIVKKTVAAPITLTEADAVILDYTQMDTTEQKIQASDKASQDEFGHSVSISGDYAIVGAYNKSSSTGDVYIYTRDASTGVWGSEQKIQASDKPRTYTNVIHQPGYGETNKRYRQVTDIKTISSGIPSV